MSKSELLAAAAAVFSRSTANELFVSSDGQVFEKGGEAHLHARTANLENPVKVGRSEAEAHVAAEAEAEKAKAEAKAEKAKAEAKAEKAKAEAKPATEGKQSPAKK